MHPYFKMVGCIKKQHLEGTLKSSFQRRFVKIDSIKTTRVTPPQQSPSASDSIEPVALVINASFSMAKEITLAITLKLPECSIMYAPGMEIAKWILKRRRIDLVVSSPELPDGTIETLIPFCEHLSPPPDLVVVGDENYDTNGEPQIKHIYSSTKYFGEGFKEVINTAQSIVQSPMIVDSQVKRLGADLRNDLNNPLQEIVAMVFVAKAGKELSPLTVQALEAIDRAAKGMAHTVSGLEERIRGIKN